MHTQTLRTLLTLPLLFALASPVLAEDDKALLAQCDLDRNGVINGPANDLPPAAWTMIEKERVCMHEYELDQLAKFMPDIRKRCDLNGNRRIDHAEPLITPLMVSGKESNGKKAYRSLPEEVRKQVDAEQKCVLDASIAQSRAEIAQSRASIAQSRAEIAQSQANIARLDAESQRFDQIIAMLPKDDVKRALNLELKNAEQALQTTRSPEQREKLETRIRIVKEQLLILKQP